MCDGCRDFNEKLYPDMGDGSSLEINRIEYTGFNADPRNGIRIAQERDVTYMGMDGVQSRHEIHCVYLPWDKIIDFVTDSMILYGKAAPEEVQMNDFFKILAEQNKREGENDNDT